MSPDRRGTNGYLGDGEVGVRVGLDPEGKDELRGRGQSQPTNPGVSLPIPTLSPAL